MEGFFIMIHARTPHIRTRAATPRRGLTLIEVLIVIAILLAIGGLVVVNLIPRKEQADIDLQKHQLQLIDSGLKQFKLDLSRYPSEEEGLAALNDKSAITDEEEANRWRGPYLENAVPKDKWGSVLIYHYPGEANPAGYDLISIGPDKQEGTEDDISNSGSQGTAAGSADTGDSTPQGDTGTTGGTGG